MQNRKNFRVGIHGQPEPEHVRGVAQPGAEFVQLHMWKVEVAESPFVQELRVRARTRQPPRDGGLSRAEDPCGRGWVQPFGQRREHHSDLVGGGFQAIQGGVESSTERGAARLTPERLNPLGLAMLAISDEGMEGSVGVAKIAARSVGTGEARGVHASGALPADFSPHARGAQE